jgi:hypothetical protein
VYGPTIGISFKVAQRGKTAVIKNSTYRKPGPTPVLGRAISAIAGCAMSGRKCNLRADLVERGPSSINTRILRAEMFGYGMRWLFVAHRKESAWWRVDHGNGKLESMP